MTSLVVRRGTEVAERSVLLVEYDAAKLSEGVSVELAAKWAYDVPSSDGRVQGVSARGAEEGVRLLSKYGEIIRVEKCDLVHQDDREAFFMATATRYVIDDQGNERKLDSVQRGKRVPKWDRRANGQGEYEVKAWFELGIVKASRNAALALMPSNVKTAILKAGLDAAAEAKRPARPQQQPRQQLPRRPEPVEGSVVTHEERQEPHAAEAADREAASAPATSPDGDNKAPTAINDYRTYWRAQVLGAGLNWNDIEALSQRDYGNRVPGQLGPKELVALAEQVGVTVPLPGQTALI